MYISTWWCHTRHEMYGWLHSTKNGKRMVHESKNRIDCLCNRTKHGPILSSATKHVYIYTYIPFTTLESNPITCPKQGFRTLRRIHVGSVAKWVVHLAHVKRSLDKCLTQKKNGYGPWGPKESLGKPQNHWEVDVHLSKYVFVQLRLPRVDLWFSAEANHILHNVYIFIYIYIYINM